MIWVHDYHFLPLAKALRERGVENKIGFFLHIPFPPPDLLTALPKHERTILSLCHYDLVGFQTDNDADNLADYLTNESRMPSRDRRTFIAGQRTMRIGVFPVGVEMAEFERLARRTKKVAVVREVRQSLADRSMIIGVDRLDYSKGIGMRMRAFEQFLTSYPRWRGSVTYLQITPRSRSDIREYADMERRIDETVGRVNGHYGEAAWTPIRYVNRPYSRSTLAGLFRSSRAALVTPLRDGMNLVAKEYVAAQDAGGSRRADPVALCRRRGGMPVGAPGQSLRSGGGGRRDRSGAVDAAGGAQGPPRQPGQGAVGERHQALGHAVHRGADAARAGRGGAESRRRRALPRRRGMIGALLGGLRRARQIERAVDQGHMRERLREIAEQLA